MILTMTSPKHAEYNLLQTSLSGEYWLMCMCVTIKCSIDHVPSHRYDQCVVLTERISAADRQCCDLSPLKELGLGV